MRPGNGLLWCWVVDDLRKPVVIELPRDRLRLDLREHVPVTVVVVADIVMVELGDPGHLEVGTDVRHVPVGDDVEAVRVHVRHEQDDRVLADGSSLGRLVGHEVVCHFGHHLTMSHLGRVQPPVDPNDRLSFLRERPSLRLGENRAVSFVRISSVRERPGDLFVAIHPSQVLRCGDCRDVQRLPKGALADLLENHPIGRRGQGLVVRGDWAVGRELEVLAGRETDDVSRRRHLGSGRGGNEQRAAEPEGEKTQIRVSHDGVSAMLNDTLHVHHRTRSGGAHGGWCSGPAFFPAMTRLPTTLQENHADLVGKYANERGPTVQELVRRALGTEVANGYTTCAQADELSDVLHLTPTSRLLDLGAGRGWPGVRISARSRCRLVSSDLIFEASVTARRQLDEVALTHLPMILAADGVGLPFRSGIFNAVVQADVLC